MPRPLRVEYPGAIYHVMNRGDRREAIFLDEQDRATFLRTLCQACEKTGWQPQAWCLMSNHFHLVVETPRGNLVAGMKWLLGTYTQRFHRRHPGGGHLFQGRYKAQVIDADTPGYLRTACDYVHLNPARARLVGEGELLQTWLWSSYPDYLRAPRFRPPWLRTDRLFGEHGILRDDGRGREEFAARTEAQRTQCDEQALASLRRGWRLGAEDFLDRLLAITRVSAGSGHGLEVYEETEEGIARRIICEELQRIGWTEKDLARRRKGDAAKIKIAHRLRAETALPLKRIGQVLQMGVPTHVAHLLYHRPSPG
ncbi:MAG: transposase [Chthoniobacterales bacterium]